MVMRGGCDRTQEAEFCNCSGHADGHKTVTHIMACCAGECIGCGRPIRDIFLEEHRKKCEPYKSISKALKQP